MCFFAVLSMKSGVLSDARVPAQAISSATQRSERERDGRTTSLHGDKKKSAAAPPQSIANCARKTCHARARGRQDGGRGGGTALTPSRWHKEKEKCFSLYSWTKAERFLMERLSLRTPRIAARSTVPFQFLLGNTLAGEERSLPPMLYRGS